MIVHSPYRFAWLLLIPAAVIQMLAMAAITRQRGEVTAYAYQSPDAKEYVAIARGLAWRGQFLQLDHDGKPLSSHPDTWRTPGYPLWLAVVIRSFGDSTTALLAANQVLAVLAVPLLWLVLRSITSPRWAMVGTIGWLLDPFRVYYSFWLMAESLFVLVLLIGLWLWIGGLQHGFSRRRIASVATISALLVLIRPIALPLPILTLLGMAWIHRRSATRLLLRSTAITAITIFIVLFPWLLRNRLLGGHWALSQQSGASFAYHKVVDVLLHERGQSDHRFDAAVLDAVRTEIDAQLQQRWERQFGPLTPQQQAELNWRQLNFGETRAVDPFIASSLLWSIGLEYLSQHKWDTLACFARQGLGLLIFPLNLRLWPPANPDSAPMAILLGSSTQQSWLRTLLPGAIGSAYALLSLVVLVKLVSRWVNRRALAQRLPELTMLFWPAAALFALTLPFEDPRFRLPLVPFLWLLAIPLRRNENGNGLPKALLS